VAAHDRAIAAAPRDVQPEIGERERDWQDAQASLTRPGMPWTPRRPRRREARASAAAGDLARLAVSRRGPGNGRKPPPGRPRRPGGRAELRRRDQPTVAR
jgi:hypothetical protein